MRRALRLGRSALLGLALASSASCYLSHERPPRDAGVDAGPISLHRCRARCGEPEVIGTLRDMTGIEALLAIDARGSYVGVLVRQYHYRDSNDFPFYALVSIDAETGAASRPIPAFDSYSVGVVAAGLHVQGVTFVATTMRSDEVGDVSTTATVAAAAWDIRSGALTWSEPSLGVSLPGLLPSGGARLGTGFGSGFHAATALVEGDTLWLNLVELDPVVRALPARPLVLWPSAPPRTTPLIGSMLTDGSIVLAGGGSAPGLDPRAGFIVIVPPGEDPIVEVLPGALFDPAPLLATREVQSYVFRYVSRSDDVAASGFVAESRDLRAAVVDRLEVATTGGLVPAATATYQGARGAGLVWVEPSGDVRVLPSMEVTARSSAWRDCGHDIEVPAVAFLPAGVSTTAAGIGGVPLLAINTGDRTGAGDDILLVVQDGPGDGGDLTIVRLPGCGIDVRPE